MNRQIGNDMSHSDCGSRADDGKAGNNRGRTRSTLDGSTRGSQTAGSDESLIHSSQTTHGDVKDEANIAYASSLPTTLGL